MVSIMPRAGFACSVIMLAASFLAPAANAASANAAVTDSGRPKTRTLGFTITAFPYALYKGADDCPEGTGMGAKEIYLQSVTPEERARLNKPDYLKELEQKAYRTPEGKDLCEATDYPRAPQVTPKGKVSFGMNLDGTADGAATESTCAHEKFTGANGEAAVDNQAYRVLGCLSNWRGFPGEEGYVESLRNASFKDGGTTFLIQVMNVEDVRNSDDVTVGLYVGTSPMMLDANGRMLPYSSLTATSDEKFRATLHGKIVDGVLTTTPAEIALSYDYAGRRAFFHFKSARIRMEINPDGTAKGMLAGYLAMPDIDRTSHTKAFLAEMAAFDCPTFAQAVKRYADGEKDPKTGQCTALSTAFNFQAIPAFVIQPEDANKAADAGPVTAH
jgi:hypothetical protein